MCAFVCVRVICALMHEHQIESARNKKVEVPMKFGERPQFLGMGKKTKRTNISKTIETIVKEGDKEVKVCALGCVPCESMRLTEEEVKERGWVVPT